MRRALLLGLLLLAGCVALREAARGYAAGESEALRTPPPGSERWSDAEWGAFYALHGDFGTLTTDNLRSNAVPWKLIRALPDVAPEPFLRDGRLGFKADPEQPLGRFGLVYGATFTGPETLHPLPPEPGVPLGYARATVHRSAPSLTLELAASNCTMCHGGRTWDASGAPLNQSYWGVPNHSLDFDGLIEAITAALDDPRTTDAALLAAISHRFPGVSEAELETYRRYVIPGFRKAVKEDTKRWGSLHAWHFGGPGFSHGVAILHESLAEDREALRPSDFPAAFTKIPNVYAVAQKEWLLVDGCYVARPEASQHARFLDYLTGFLPVLGAAPERAVQERPRLEKLLAFLESLRPPAFPGPIDRAAAERGRATYAGRCAGCHGDREADGSYRYPSRRVPVEAIGTDPTRAQAIRPELAERFNRTAIGEFMRVEPTGAYVPPPLSGVWANAPYFHNGSVPTLWGVLTPEARPARFWVGGHRLDLERVGVALVEGEGGAWTYPAGYVPWSEPRLYDTAEPGRSNRGHERQVAGLAEPERRDLLEYLKTL